MAIETAASKCYDSIPSADGKIMDACYKSGHHSVLEHVSFEFEISGVSRSLLSQITRHRIASYSVRSQRYCKEDGFKYVIPQNIRNNPVARVKFEQGMNYISRLYSSLVNDYEVEPEDARAVLPNACETTFVFTINLRSLINFMNHRLCMRAQQEIRELANKMKNLIAQQASQFTYMLVPKCEIYAPYCFCTEHKSCGRHSKLSEVYSNKKQENYCD